MTKIRRQYSDKEMEVLIILVHMNNPKINHKNKLLEYRKFIADKKYKRRQLFLEKQWLKLRDSTKKSLIFKPRFTIDSKNNKNNY